MVPVVLLLLRVAYAQASPRRMSYVVKWGKEKFVSSPHNRYPSHLSHRLYFPLPHPDTKLAIIRQLLAEHTHLPLDSFKLVHAGAVMKDDNAPSNHLTLYSTRLVLTIVSIQFPRTASGIIPRSP